MPTAPFSQLGIDRWCTALYESLSVLVVSPWGLAGPYTVTHEGSQGDSMGLGTYNAAGVICTRFNRWVILAGPSSLPWAPVTPLRLRSSPLCPGCRTRWCQKLCLATTGPCLLRAWLASTASWRQTVRVAGVEGGPFRASKSRVFTSRSPPWARSNNSVSGPPLLGVANSPRQGLP